MVSDGYHIFRVKKMLEFRGLKVYGSPRSLNAPNDLCQTANGNIYFTDPGTTASAVYLLTPAGRKRLSESMRKRWAAKRAGIV